MWSKTNFEPTDHHHPRSSTLPRICTVPSASAIFKCILKAVFCKGIEHRLRFCLDHLSCIKMAAFQFYLQSGKQRKVGWLGVDSYVVFGQKFPSEKGSVRRYVVVMQQPALSSPKFGANFHAVAKKCHTSMWN
jgi:hypothetical protein